MKLIILSIGRDFIQTTETFFKKKADTVIQIDEINKENYTDVRKKAYQAFKQWQSERIELVLSGPLAFSFTLGQLVGLNHFDIQVYHYDADHREYITIPMPDRKEVL